MPRTTIQCKQCWKSVHSSAGLSRHKCKPPENMRPMPKDVQSMPEQPSYTEFDIGFPPDTRKQPVIISSRKVANIRSAVIDDSTNKESTAALDLDIDIETYDLFADEHQDAYGGRVGDRTETIETEAASSSDNTRLEYFEYSSDSTIHPGQHIPLDQIDPAIVPKSIHCDIDPENPWWPFASEHDWDIAKWFSRSKVSKGAIQDYLATPSLVQSAQDTKIRSYNNLMDAIYSIPYGIPGGDEWYEHDITIPSQVKGVQDHIYTVLFRDVKPCLEFLLGFKPFAPDLVWAPVRKFYDSRDSRIYDEMHTGDWWWEQQESLPPGATVVPLILATDKTLMTKLQGDQTAWPVYLTIGNHLRHSRRRQKLPTTLLIGFLPIAKDITKLSDEDMSAQVKSFLYHKSMGIILQGVKDLEMSGWLVYCADNYIRRCFPIIAHLVCDYQEVVLITGIKQNAHCGKCVCPPKELEEILQTWPLRTHEQMQEQMRRQTEDGIDKKDSNWVHKMECFAWHHMRVNIHDAISVDILHQLQKGLFKYAIDWVQDLIKDLHPAARATKGIPRSSRTYKDSPGLVRLDARFAAIPHFQGLKHFKAFSHISQWTGSEERDLLKILIATVTPLLLDRAPNAIEYLRAVVDFITIVSFQTHDTETISYLNQCLFRIYHFKDAFAKYRPKDSEWEEAHWNTPKMHSVSHYVRHIIQYGAPNGADSEHMEVRHKVTLKAFFERTNKNIEFIRQLAAWNTRETNLMAMDYLLLHYFGTTSKSGVQITAETTSMAKTPIKVAAFGCRPLSSVQTSSLQSYGLDPKVTTTALHAQEATSLVGFTAALAEFVQENRTKLQDNLPSINDKDLSKADFSWIYSYPVQFYGHICCWKRSGKDESNSEAEMPEVLRCTPNWRGKGPRKDQCWVQEFPPSKEASRIAENTSPRSKQPDNPLNGQRVGCIQALVKVFDIGYKPDQNLRRATPAYCAVLVDVYPLKDRGIPHKIHGMIEVLRPQIPTINTPRILKGRHFYALPLILRSAHVVPSFVSTECRASDVFYINNYIDWDQYQMLYEDDWITKGYAKARKVGKIYEGAKQRARAALVMKRTEEEKAQHQQAAEEAREEQAALKEIEKQLAGSKTRSRGRTRGGRQADSPALNTSGPRVQKRSKTPAITIPRGRGGAKNMR